MKQDIIIFIMLLKIIYLMKEDSDVYISVIGKETK